MTSKTKYIIIGLICFAVTVGITYFILRVSYSNGEIRQRNLVLAQQETCKAFFDKMWKVLQQKAEIADQYKDAFKDIYPGLIAGRYSNDNGGSQMFMKWVTEHNPSFDLSLYRDLSNAVESERTSFFYEQKKLISMNNEHRNKIMTFPGTWFLAGREAIAIIVITSDATASAYETKQENNLDLFKR